MSASWKPAKTHSFGMLILMWVFTVYFPAQMVRLKASITSVVEKCYGSEHLRFLATVSMGLIRFSELIV